MAALTRLLDQLRHQRGSLGHAWFSRDRAHRYLLTRGDLDGPAPLVAFVMLNPSTADADHDDRTIARCRSFAARFTRAAPRVAIVNLFSIRATDPSDAFAHPRPNGPRNDQILAAIAHRADLVIAAWGADRRCQARAVAVHQTLALAGIRLHRIGPPSLHGHPKHPLYLRSRLALEAA